MIEFKIKKRDKDIVDGYNKLVIPQEALEYLNKSYTCYLCYSSHTKKLFTA